MRAPGSSALDNLPDYDELPPAPDGGRSAWGLFGPDDSLGTVNLLTDERVAAAATLVHRGAMFPLDVPLDFFAPALNPFRGTPRHQVMAQPGGMGLDDVWDNVWPQAGSQWDSLGHIGYRPDAYYNGATSDDVTVRGRNTIGHWARHGLAGRGVLLDLLRAREADGRPYDPGSSEPFGVHDLEMAQDWAGVELGAGDILLLHTGFAAWYGQQTPEIKRKLPGAVCAPGLEQSEEVCRWVWNQHLAAIGSDTFAVEAWPANPDPRQAPFGFIHQMLIGSFGLPLGELWWLDDLAGDCARTGTYEGLFVSVPMQAPRGISSPPNAIVIK